MYCADGINIVSPAIGMKNDGLIKLSINVGNLYPSKLKLQPKYIVFAAQVIFFEMIFFVFLATQCSNYVIENGFERIKICSQIIENVHCALNYYD